MLSRRIKELFPETLEVYKTYTRRLRQDGSDYASFTRHKQTYPRLEESADGKTYSVYTYRDFNIGSPPQRIRKLLSLGWEPTTFTKKGNPKVDEDELLKFAEKSKEPRIGAIAEWMVLEGRSTMVEGWLKASRELKWPLEASRKPVESLSAIYGRGVATCGAQSRRMTHWEPNTANIPSEANGAKYGKEVRELWIARPGRKLVGVDAKSCQPRLLLHYLNAPKWLQDIYLTEPGIHNYNAKGLTEALGFEVKRGGGGAKTLYLAFIFGSKDPKLGSILKKSRTVGAKVRETLYKLIPGIEKLQKDCEQEYYKHNGWLECLDGGWVRCPSPHASVNYRIQPAEAVVMKKAAIILRDKLGSLWNREVLQVGVVHDEILMDVEPEVSSTVMDFGRAAIKEAGEYYNLKLELEGDAKEGNDWSQVH